MTITFSTVLAAMFGAFLAFIGVLGGAVAERIRWRNVLPALPALASEPRAVRATRTPNTPPPRRPQRRVAPVAAPARAARRDDVADWLEGMGYNAEDARRASTAARRELPDGAIEDHIRIAMSHLPESN